MNRKRIAILYILPVVVGFVFLFIFTNRAFVVDEEPQIIEPPAYASSESEPTTKLFERLVEPLVVAVAPEPAARPLIVESGPVAIPEHMKRLAIAQPMTDTSIVGEGFNIFGTSNPAEGLYVNGRTVTNRVEEGFFNVFVSLSPGENIFVFSQDGQNDVTRVIYREAEVLEPDYIVLSRAEFLYAFPTQMEYISVGETLFFSVIAPIGAQVKVSFNGEELLLLPERRAASVNAERIYATTFSVAYIMPAREGLDAIIDIGRPLYSMEFEGQSISTYGAMIRLIGEQAAFHATVTADAAWTFPNPRLAGGPSWSLTRGQQALVRRTTEGGDWVELDTGMWIQRENVTLGFGAERVTNAFLSVGRYEISDFTHSIIWEAAYNPAARVDFDGHVLRMYFAMQEDVPEIDLTDVSEQDLFFSSKTSGMRGGVPYYAFTIRTGINVEGFYTRFANGEFVLNIKQRRALAEGDYPLSGFTFVIDAGHGGHDSGARGAMGIYMSEKDINLINARNLAGKLEELGAVVVLTRSTDVFLTLQERTQISRMIKPDMFISIHADSTVETTDATNIHGVSFWYRNPNSRALAEHFTNELHYINPRTTRIKSANHANFFVCRPTWTPSVIVEASFMNNINDFAWMLNPENQQALADGLASAILSYYYITK